VPNNGITDEQRSGSGRMSDIRFKMVMNQNITWAVNNEQHFTQQRLCEKA